MTHNCEKCGDFTENAEYNTTLEEFHIICDKCTKERHYDTLDLGEAVLKALGPKPNTESGVCRSCGLLTNTWHPSIKTRTVYFECDECVKTRRLELDLLLKNLESI